MSGEFDAARELLLARGVVPRAATNAAKLLQAIRERGKGQDVKITLNELQSATGLGRTSVWLARGILVASGLVTVTDSKGDRQGSFYGVLAPTRSESERVTHSDSERVRMGSEEYVGTYNTTAVVVASKDLKTNNNDNNKAVSLVATRPFSERVTHSESEWVPERVERLVRDELDRRALAVLVAEEITKRINAAAVSGTAPRGPAAETAVTPAPISPPSAFFHPANTRLSFDAPNWEAEDWAKYAKKIASFAKKDEAKTEFFALKLMKFGPDVRRRAIQGVLVKIAQGKPMKDATDYCCFLAGIGDGFEGGSWENFDAELEAMTRPRSPSSSTARRAESEFEKLAREMQERIDAKRKGGKS